MSDKVDRILRDVVQMNLERLVQIYAYDRIREKLENIGTVLSWDLNGRSRKAQAKLAELEGIEDISQLVQKVRCWDKNRPDPGTEMDVGFYYEQALRRLLKRRTMKQRKEIHDKVISPNAGKYSNERWEVEYIRLALLFHQVCLEIREKKVWLSEDVLKSFDTIYCSSNLSCLRKQQRRRIESLKKSTAKRKEKPRQRILGMAIDELLRTKGGHIKSAKQYAIEKFTGLRKKKGESEEDKKKRRSIIQNVRRKYLPKGFEIDPVFKFSLKMIEEDRGEELNELKSNLGGKGWSNSPPSGSQDQHYVHLSKAQAGAWFKEIAKLAAKESPAAEHPVVMEYLPDYYS